MTYVVAKFGLRIRDSKPSDTGSRGHSEPMDVDAVNSLSRLPKEKGSSSPRDGCFMCGKAHLQRDYNARKNTGKQSFGKGQQSKSWSRVRTKVRVKRTRENPKVRKARTRAKHRTTALSGLGNSKSETSSETQESAQTGLPDTSWNDGWNCDEWNDGWSFDE